MMDKLFDDLRFPIGLLFVIFSSILLFLGLAHPEIAKPGSDINLNLYAGTCMGVFGLFMLISAVCSAKCCCGDCETEVKK